MTANRGLYAYGAEGTRLVRTADFWTKIPGYCPGIERTQLEVLDAFFCFGAAFVGGDETLRR